MSLSMMPPCIVALVAFWCFLATLIPSTMTLPASGNTRVTLPVLPRSLPLRTFTWSPFLILRPAMSDHLRCERHDLHELLVPELTAHRAEDTGAARVHLVVDQHGGVLVEADVAAVGTALLLLHPDDDALHDLALLDGRAGDGVLDGGDEDVADAGVAPLGAAEHADAEDLLGPTVVRDSEARLLLDHRTTSPFPGSPRGASA